MSLFLDDPGVSMDRKFFEATPKTLKKLAPEYKKYEHVVKVFDVKKNELKIAADILSQKVVCYFG